MAKSVIKACPHQATWRLSAAIVPRSGRIARAVIIAGVSHAGSRIQTRSGTLAGHSGRTWIASAVPSAVRQSSSVSS